MSRVPMKAKWRSKCMSIDKFLNNEWVVYIMKICPKIINASIFLVIVLIMFSANPFYLRKKFFSKEDLRWVTDYQYNDTLIFQCRESFDTLTVIRKETYEPENDNPFDFEKHSFNTPALPSSTDLYFQLAHNNVKYDGSAFFTVSVFLKEISCSVNIGGWFSSYLPPQGFICFDKSAVQHFRVNRDTATSIPDGAIPEFKEMVWAQDYGMIEYSFENGDVYRLVKHIKQDGDVIEY